MNAVSMEDSFKSEGSSDDADASRKGLGQENCVLAEEEETCFARGSAMANDAATAGAMTVLSSAVKNSCIADLKKSTGKVKELIHNQNVLRESIQQELTSLNENKLSDDIAEFVTELRTYHEKLKNIKKDIQCINDKVSKMKRKTSKLRSSKEKEEKQIQENKRKELELQQQLTAKPAAQLYDQGI